MKHVFLLTAFFLVTVPFLAQTEVRKDSIAVLFDFNRSEVIHPEVLTALLAKRDLSGISSVYLAGYTDSVGSIARNELLADERIRSVRKILDKTPFRKLEINYLNRNETSGFRAAPDELNRRVDILIFGKNDPPKPKQTLTFELNKPVNLNVNFKGGTAEFLTTAYPNLEILKKTMLEDTTLLVKLHGHVCCANDMELSVKRAYAVMRYLSQNEIDSKRMTAVGFSNSQPLVPDDSEANMSRNRRVEAIFYRKE